MWLALGVVLWLSKPDDLSLRELVRLLPDLLVLLKRLAEEPTIPKGVRVRLVLLLGYLAWPIDLIPDFIPVLGLVDDLVILPLGILLVVKLIPPDIMAEHRARALALRDQPRGTVAAVAVVVIWLALATGTGWAVWAWWRGHN